MGDNVMFTLCLTRFSCYSVGTVGWAGVGWGGVGDNVMFTLRLTRS